MSWRDVCIPACIINVLFSVCAAPLYAQDATAVKNFPLKEIKISGVDIPYYLLDWIPASKSKSVAFIQEYIKSEFTDNLVSFNVSKKGKASSFARSIEGVEFLSSVDTVWIGAETSVGPSKAKEYGLVFVAYLMETASEDKAVFAVAKLLDSGKIDGSFKTLLEVKPPKDNLIDWPELSATKGDDSVGISAHFMLIENSSSFSGIANTPTYFIQTDFKGKLLDVTEIPPPEKKKYIYFSPGKPGWNGVNWIVAGCYTKLSTSKSSSGKTTTIPASNALYVYAVPNKGVSPSKKIKLQKLFSDDQEEFVTYPMLYFLPKDDSGSPAGEIFSGAKQKGETLKLVASHVDFVSEENQELDSYTVNYYLIPINDVPKQAGIVVPIRIPDWEHKISFDTGMEIRDYTDVCSEYCMADQNHFYLAQTRFVKVAANAAPANPANGYVYENQFNLYYINTLNGLVQTIATGDLDAEGSWRHVVIGWFNGSVGVINQFTPSDYLTNGLHYYMTMIKP